MEEYQITADMTGSKMLFAGIRFFISGIIILAIARSSHREFGFKKKAVQENVWFLLLYALLNTTLHYAFFYFGLSHNAGARSAILNSMSVFTVVIFACIFFKSDRMTWRKALEELASSASWASFALNLWRKGKRKFHIPGRWYDYPQCPVWSQCFPADPRLEQEGGCFRRNRLFVEHRWSLAGDSCIVNGWLSASHQPLGHHPPSAAHCHLNHQFRSLQ